MCCFSTKTEVRGTSIFARFVRPGTQVLVYQMRFAAERPTAMILPLPVALPAKEDSVRFKSLKEYPGFFTDLAAGFPALPSSGLMRSKSAPESHAVAAAAPLAVHDVGDFVATFVPSVKDFGRVDARFVIPKDVWDRIPAYADYGFAVFQLKELSGSPHPIALELDTRSPDKLFFPTVHIHDGKVHEQADFDHALYCQKAATRRLPGWEESPLLAAAFMKTDKAEGLLDGQGHVYRRKMRGELKNADVLV